MGVLKPNIDLFGSMAVKLGFCTQPEVDEALELQQKLKSEGKLRPIGELLVEKKFLTAAQQTKIARALGIYTGPIPGFSIIRKLGHGAMGAVYLAKDSETGNLVAVKLISSLATDSGVYGQRLLSEAKLASQIRHPSLISPIRVAENDGAYYMLMEFFESENTRDLLQREGALAEPRALGLARQIAAALAEIGRHGIIHGDVKPENVLVNAQGTAKLCDFGVSRKLDSASPARRKFAGTPAYASPEALLGEETDLRSDQYCFGATIFHWVTGRRPFEPPAKTESSTKFFIAQVHQDGPDPRTIMPALSEDLAGVITRMLRRDRRERYPSPEAVVQALASV